MPVDEQARARLDSLEGRMLSVESTAGRVEQETKAQTPILQRLDRVVGSPPSHAEGLPGSGMAATLAGLVEERRDAKRLRSLAWGLVAGLGVLVGIAAGVVGTLAKLKGW